MKVRLALLALLPLILLGSVIVTPWRYLWCALFSTSKAWNIALMVDQTCNVDANGRVDQTISARAELASERGTAWGCILCKILNAIQPNHCKDAINEEGNSQDESGTTSA